MPFKMTDVKRPDDELSSKFCFMALMLSGAASVLSTVMSLFAAAGDRHLISAVKQNRKRFLLTLVLLSTEAEGKETIFPLRDFQCLPSVLER